MGRESLKENKQLQSMNLISILMQTNYIKENCKSNRENLNTGYLMTLRNYYCFRENYDIVVVFLKKESLSFRDIC